MTDPKELMSRDICSYEVNRGLPSVRVCFLFSQFLLSHITRSLHGNGDLNDFIILHKNLPQSKCTLTFAPSLARQV